ncbi:hypothetical protein V3C99_016175 [Haemonchus contortus]
MTTLSRIFVGSGVSIIAFFSILKVLRYLYGGTVKEVEDNEANGYPRRRYHSKMIKIPQRSVGIVLGRGGSNIRAVERETKTFIKVFHYGKRNGRSNTLANRIRGSHDVEEWTSADSNNSSPECEFAFVEIRGETEENIRQAQMEIYSFISDSKTSVSTKCVCVPSHVIGYIIGKEGANLREIRRNHHVRVDIEPETFSNTRKITITGSPKSILLAEARINQLMSRHRNDNAADGDEDFERQMLEIKRIQEDEDEEW